LGVPEGTDENEVKTGVSESVSEQEYRNRISKEKNKGC
jgi:hypothetical protein